MKEYSPIISIVIPCFNEQDNVMPLCASIGKVLDKTHRGQYELVIVNDGSTDATSLKLKQISKQQANVKIINLSRNFGKEIATTVGLHNARGEAIIMIDSDGQHPPQLIPQFIEKWQNGAQIVIGVRNNSQHEGFIKKFGSKLFYNLFNRYTGSYLVPGSTDFCLIDKAVQNEFTKMTERNRITRGLIGWLGFKREYIEFEAEQRVSGSASYSISKLIGLALNSFVSLSLRPLYFSVYAGLFIMPLSILLTLFCVIEMLAGDPLKLNISGSAYLTLLTLFLVGILLISQGIIALYLTHIHSETQNRPLYIIESIYESSKRS